jgi:UDP-N-acetyl-2-amino-2-deoxyglucuronate dehydrogenase
MALRTNANTICEKPIVINPWNLDALQELEQEYEASIYTVLQLRLHPVMLELKRQLENEENGKRHQVDLTYITSRGKWYLRSWKGSEERSGGLVLNIGIHFFDILIWLFGPVQRTDVFLRENQKARGFIELKNADVKWFLSVDYRDLPFDPEPGVRTTYRNINIDGQAVEFTRGFTDLHTALYEKTIAGEGFTLNDARPSLELVHTIRTAPVKEKMNNGLF